MRCNYRSFTGFAHGHMGVHGTHFLPGWVETVQRQSLAFFQFSVTTCHPVQSVTYSALWAPASWRGISACLGENQVIHELVSARVSMYKPVTKPMRTATA